MALIRWNPMSLSSLLDEEFDLPMGLSRLGLGGGLNLYETKDKVVAEAAVPGIPEDNLDVTVENGVVRIAGSVEQKQDKQEEGVSHYMSTLSSAINYAFRLPQNVLDKEPKAELHNGVLTLSFDKPAEALPKKIKVTARALQDKEVK